MATGLFGSLAVFDHKNSDLVFNERLKQFFIANEIKEETRKKTILMNTLNEECYVLLRNLCIPDLPETKTYSEIIDILTVYFSPYFSERLKFYNARKSMSESVSEWEAKLKSLATNSKFSEEQLKIVLRDIFVIGMGNEKIMSRLFEEDASSEAVTLASVVKIALAKESAIKEQKEVQVVAAEAVRTNIKVKDVHFSRSPESSRVHKGIATGPQCKGK
ncbi:uncharacterized protein isoform X1 [Leptinotarsa decemlineata]|uniref:uncharacterized protein isoform X1 n=1 Tax=Leptinotarsa decemlineata TaxID=7539 RepID=UPI003D30997F